MAHDFLGNELSIGDDVVFLNYNGTSANLERGKITNVSDAVWSARKPTPREPPKGDTAIEKRRLTRDKEMGR